MCAILDANAAHEVFGADPQTAGGKFFTWINQGKGILVVGGKLLAELEGSGKGSREWVSRALTSGRVRVIDADRVDTRTAQVAQEGICTSNDPHILALAQVSGARLLYSNDAELHKDFRNKRLIDDPRGKVYSTLQDKSFTASHKRLLAAGDLCRVRQ